MAHQKSRYLFITLFFATSLLAKIHYAKVEPIERYTIKSDVSGLVLYSAKELEGKFVKSATIIQLDDSDERIKLADAKEALKLEEESLKLNQELIPQLEEAYKREKAYYERLSSVSSSSQAQKDSAYSTMVGAKNQYISAKTQLLLSREKISQLISKIALLQNTISRKKISLNGRYLYSLLVKEGDFVSIGREVIRADDISSSRLKIYLDRDELDDMDKKRVYINGKLNKNAKIDKVWRVSDSRYISKYRVEIVVNPPLPFSKLVKVELKR